MMRAARLRHPSLARALVEFGGKEHTRRGIHAQIFHLLEVDSLKVRSSLCVTPLLGHQPASFDLVPQRLMRACKGVLSAASWFWREACIFGVWLFFVLLFFVVFCVAVGPAGCSGLWSSCAGVRFVVLSLFFSFLFFSCGIVCPFCLLLIFVLFRLCV